MTSEELKAARAKLGLSAEAFAAAFGIADGRLIRRYEAAEVGVPGPLAVAVRYMLRHGPDRAAINAIVEREGHTKTKERLTYARKARVKEPKIPKQPSRDFSS